MRKKYKNMRKIVLKYENIVLKYEKNINLKSKMFFIKNISHLRDQISFLDQYFYKNISIVRSNSLV